MKTLLKIDIDENAKTLDVQCSALFSKETGAAFAEALVELSSGNPYVCAALFTAIKTLCEVRPDLYDLLKNERPAPTITVNPNPTRS